MKKFILTFVFILLLLIFIIVVLVKVCLDRMDKDNMKHLYRNTFGKDADCLTLQKWIAVHKKNKKKFYQYNLLVSKSKEECQSETIVFVGLIRNNGKETISFWYPMLQKLGSYFKDYKVLFIENDSEDDTREVLLSLSEQNDHYDVFCPGDHLWNEKRCQLGIVSARNRLEKKSHIEDRIRVLSHLRESYLEQIKLMDGVDYVMVIDWDLKGDFTPEGFFHSLSLLRKDKIMDGVAVNSFHKDSNTWLIYDTYPLFPNYQCRQIGRDSTKLDKKILKKYNDLFLESTSPIHVSSAFGGMAIYKFQSLVRKDPHYISNECPYQCEHSNLNKNLNIFIDPWFIFLVYKNMH